MADNLNGGPAFKEVIDLSVNEAKFKSSLDAAEKLYAAFLNRLGKDAKEALSASAMTGLKDEVKSFGDDMKVVIVEVASSVTQLTKNFATLMDKLESSRVIRKRTSDAKKDADDVAKAQIEALAKIEKQADKTRQKFQKASEEALKAASAGLKGDASRDKVARNIDIEQEGTENLTTEKNQRALERLNKTFTRTVELFRQLDRARLGKDFVAQIQQAEAEIEKLQERLKDLDNKASLKTGSGLIVGDEEQKDLEAYNALLKDLTATTSRLQSLREKASAKEKKDADERAKALAGVEKQADAARAKFQQASETDLKAAAAAEEAAAKRDRAARKLAEDIGVEQEGQENRALDEQAKLRKRINDELEKANQLMGRTKVTEFGSDLKGKLAEIRAQLAEVNRELAKMGSVRGLGRSGELSPGDVDAARKYNALLAQREQLTSKLNTVQGQITRQTEQSARASQGFFDRITGGFQGTFAHLIRYYVAFSAINTVLDTIRGTITGIFDTIAAGIKYTQQLERNTSQLSGELAANVKFTEDLAKNFQLAREAAKEVTELLEDRAIESGIGVESIESTFRALLEGGGQRGVANLRELVDLSVLFQKSLEAAGVGGLAAQGSIQEISKLFQGFPEPQNKFLAFLHMSSEEWVKMRTEGEKHRDLLPRINERIRPYLSSLEQAKNDQAVLVARIDLLGKRLTSLASEPLFNKLSDLARRLLEFLDDNRGKVIAFIRTISDGMELVISQFERFSRGDFLSDRLLNFMLGIQKVITLSSASLLTLIESAGNALDSKGAGDFLARQAATAERALKAIKELEESQAEIRRVFTGTVLPSELGPDGQFGGPGKPSLLDAQFDPNSPPPPPKPDTQNALAEFEEQKQKYLKGVEDIQEATRIAKDRVEELASTQAISLAEASRRVSNIVDSELTAIRQLDQGLKSAIATTQRRISGDRGTTDPVERQKNRDRFDAQILALQREQQKREFNIAREKIAADKKAATEANAVLRDSFDQRLRIIKQAQDRERELLQAGLEVGTLTQTEFFDRVEQLTRESTQLRLEEIDTELSRLGKGTAAYEKLANQRELVEREMTSAAIVFGAQRQAVVEKETEQIQEFAARLRELDSQTAEIFLRLSQQLNPEAGFNSQVADLFTIRNRELDLLESQKLKLLEIARAKNAESETTRKLILDLRDLEGQRQRLFSDRVQQIAQGTGDVSTRNFFLRDATIEEGLRLRQRRDEAAARLNLFDAQKGPFLTTILGTNPKLVAEREQLVKELESINQALGKFSQQVEAKVLPSFQNAFGRFFDSVFGPGLRERINKAATAQEKLAVGAQLAANGLASIQGVVNTFKQGRQQGGTLGGVGAVVGQFSEALSAIPVVGQFLPAIGGILQFVGGLFTASAKRIAENVKKSFQETLERFQAGNLTLIDTITELERQRNDAIIRLSGTKGGKSELDKILPELDRQIEDLRRRQRQILDDFDSSLDNLRLNSDVLSTISKKWQDINKQVKDYIGAGGDAAKAAEFLSLNLASIRQDAADQLAQAEQEAIGEAIRLNELLEQRAKLVKDFAEQEFNLVNADAIERRQAGSVQRGRQLEELRKQRDEQLAALDQQIRLTNQRVEREREVFNLTNEIASLRRRDEELTLLALDAQIARLKDLKTVVAGITLGANGMFGVAAGAIPGVSIGTIQVTVSPYPGMDVSSVGREIGDSIGDELERRFRLSP